MATTPLRAVALLVAVLHSAACLDPNATTPPPCSTCALPTDRAVSLAPWPQVPSDLPTVDPDAWYDAKRPAIVAAVASALGEFPQLGAAIVDGGLDVETTATRIAALLVRDRDRAIHLDAVAAAQLDGTWAAFEDGLAREGVRVDAIAPLLEAITLDLDDPRLGPIAVTVAGALRDALVARVMAMPGKEVAALAQLLYPGTARATCSVDDPSTWDVCLVDVVEGIGELVDSLVTSLVSPCNPTGRWLMLAGLVGMGVSLGYLIAYGCVRLAVIIVLRWIFSVSSGAGGVVSTDDVLHTDRGTSPVWCYAYMGALIASIAILAWGQSMNRPEDCPSSEHPVVPPLPCVGGAPLLSLDGTTVGPEIATRPRWPAGMPLAYTLRDPVACAREDVACPVCVDSNTDVCDPGEFAANGGAGVVQLTPLSVEMSAAMWNHDGALGRSTSNTTYPPYRGEFRLATGVRPGDRYEKLQFKIPFGKWSSTSPRHVVPAYAATAAVRGATGAIDWGFAEISWELAVRRKDNGEEICLSRVRGVRGRFSDAIEAAGIYTNRDLYLDGNARRSRFGILAINRCVGTAGADCAALDPLVELTCTTAPGRGVSPGDYVFTLRPLLEGRAWDTDASARVAVEFPVDPVVGGPAHLSMEIRQCE